MFGIKRHIFYFVLIMIVGLLGRIVDGSKVIPPQAPFSAPFEYQADSVSHECSTTESETFHLADAAPTKVPTHSAHTGTRPWFGILDYDFNDNSWKLLSLVFPPINPRLISADLQSSSRPPSC